MNRIMLLAIFFAAALFSMKAACGDDFAEQLRSGNHAANARAYQKILEANPNDDNLRFKLGILQFLSAIETTGQSWYQHGQ